MSLEALVADWGLAAVAAGAGIEGETAAVLGGVFAHEGYWPWWAAAMAAMAGSFVIDQTCFHAGRHWRDHPRIVRLRRTRAYARALAAFEKHPIGFIFAFRFLYGLRTVSPLAIGTSAIRARRFVVANLAAAAVWATIFTGVGYAFGRAFERWIGLLKPHLFWLLALGLAVALVVWGVHRLRGGHREHDSGEAA